MDLKRDILTVILEGNLPTYVNEIQSKLEITEFDTIENDKALKSGPGERDAFQDHFITVFALKMSLSDEKSLKNFMKTKDQIYSQERNFSLGELILFKSSLQMFCETGLYPSAPNLFFHTLKVFGLDKYFCKMINFTLVIDDSITSLDFDPFPLDLNLIKDVIFLDEEFMNKLRNRLKEYSKSKNPNF